MQGEARAACYSFSIHLPSTTASALRAVWFRSWPLLAASTSSAARMEHHRLPTPAMVGPLAMEDTSDARRSVDATQGEALAVTSQ